MAPPTNGDSISGHDLAATYADNIKGKVVLVTGTSQGSLGEEYCLAIAKSEPKLLIVAGRNVEKLQFIISAIAKANPKVATKSLNLDLESVAEVKKAAATINSWDDVPHIDVFCHHAAIMGTPYGTTVDGFERQLGVNYIAPWVFTNSILPKILKSQSPRIVLLSSDGHRWGPVRWHDPNFKVIFNSLASSKQYQRLTILIMLSYRVARTTTDGTLMASQRRRFSFTLCI